MDNEIDYVGIFREMSDTELSEALVRLKAEFADPYTSISSSGQSSSRDRTQIAVELAACVQVAKERRSARPRNRVRVSFRA